VNLARWVRNYLAVGNYFWGPDPALAGYQKNFRDTLARGNHFIAGSLTELFDYYESGNYLKDEGKQKKQIRTTAESMNKLLSKSLKKMLKKLQG
jgi:hypothetical protein